MTAEPPGEAGQLRARATRCRAFAKEYSSDVGASLDELAVELDKKADRIDRQGRRDPASGQTER